MSVPCVGGLEFRALACGFRCPKPLYESLASPKLPLNFLQGLDTA